MLSFNEEKFVKHQKYSMCNKQYSHHKKDQITRGDKGRTFRKLIVWGGGGEVQKRYSPWGKIKRKKNSCTPINPKKYSCFGLKKIHTKNLITKKNSCSSKIPLPRPITFLMVRPSKESLTRRIQSLLLENLCLVPRPHYYERPKRFGSLGPRKFLRPSPGRSSRIRHRNALTERAWKDAVQGPGKENLVLGKKSYQQTKKWE